MISTMESAEMALPLLSVKWMTGRAGAPVMKQDQLGLDGAHGLPLDGVPVAEVREVQDVIQLGLEEASMLGGKVGSHREKQESARTVD